MNSTSEPQKRGFSPWFVLAMIVPIYLLSIFYRMTPATLAEYLVTDLHVNYAGLSVISSATFITYGLMQLPSGIISDALGGRKSICLITLIACIGTVLFAFSTSIGPATFSRLLTGIGCAVIVPCLSTLAQYCPTSRFSRMNGILVAIGLGGTVCAGTPLALAAESIGWRTSLLICAAIDLALIVVVWLCLKEKPIAVAELAVQPPKSNFRESCMLLWTGFLIVIKEPKFWPYCIWISCNVGLYFALCGLWWGPWMREGLGLSLEESAQVASIAFLFMLPWQPIAGMISDYFQTRKKVLLVATVFGFMASLMPPLLGTDLSRPLLYLYALSFAVFTCNVSCVVYAAVRELFPLRMVGTALGCVQTLPFLIFVPLIQTLFSYVLEWRTAATGGIINGYTQAMWFSPLVIGISLVSICFMHDTASKTHEEALPQDIALASR